ncbi:hypothetical protein BWI97_17525 [Siphonobacter sp. BAB-5405]|uniref:hypothetical protein n=1 Tax=Siphonobacter sp. BAB-5405 TaxID=1864825 RepID=UPI000C8029CB|nr:hypothetical protein [Siphonobacter sp. BAB-5405]PMD93743.1 hypothetical protein BWI97_17525 [Siphonobacter sp. BAB-5405]
MLRLFSFITLLFFITSCKKETDPITESFDSKNLIRRWTLSTIEADWEGKNYSIDATKPFLNEMEYKADGTSVAYNDKEVSDTGTWKLTDNKLEETLSSYSEKLVWPLKSLSAQELVMESPLHSRLRGFLLLLKAGLGGGVQ